MKLFTLIMIISASFISVESTVDNPVRVCENVAMEIGIALDYSASMTIQNLNTVKQFLKDFVNKFEINFRDNGTRVGILSYTYYDKPVNLIRLNERNTTANVAAAIDDISQSQYNDVNHSHGLFQLSDQLLSRETVRPGVARVGIVLTDERSRNLTQTRVVMQEEIRRRSFIMFAIGIGLSNYSELNEIAGNGNRVFQLNSYEELNSIVDTLASQTCLEVEQFYPELEPTFELCDNKSIELGIVLDSSSSLRPIEYNSSIKFLQRLLRKFAINSEQNKIRVSVIPFGYGIYPEIGFNLTTYNTTDQVVEAIGNISFKAGSYTSTGAAIKHMHTVQMASNFVRPGVKKVGIVLTDGGSQQRRITRSEAKAARSSGIIMYAVGVGDYIDNDELYDIAGHSKRVIIMRDYGRHENNVNNVANRTCTAGEPQGKFCDAVNSTDIFFLFSPDDLETRSHINWAVTFVNLTVRREAVQENFRYGLLSSMAVCDDDFGLNVSTCGDVGNIEQQLNQNTGNNLENLAKKLANSSFALEGGVSNNIKKIVVIVAKSSEVTLLADEVQALQNNGIRVFIACIDGSGCTLSGTEILTHSVTTNEAPRILSDKLLQALHLPV